MKTFHCQHCGHSLFFENVSCLQCGSSVAFVPERLTLAAIEPTAQDPNTWQVRRDRHPQHEHEPNALYRLCQNQTTYQACNFVVPVGDANPLCVSCRQTRVLPDLSVEGNLPRWRRIEAAKRRLYYTLAQLRLVDPTGTQPNADSGPVYEFLADLPGQPALTGHDDGLITLNIAEADDAERVKRRQDLQEPYRTLLGHLRHECGHYYWDRLIRDGGGNRLEEFRAVFGDERKDYGEALKEHYAANGHRDANWQQSYVSAYAMAHPWEDWAETWAHYLHMVDLLETAAAYNTHISPPGNPDHELEEVVNPFEVGQTNFEQLVAQWIPLTLLLNSLNRSLGQEDAYPFALAQKALEKLKNIRHVIKSNQIKD